MLYVFIALVVIGSIIGWLVKLVLRRRMQDGLGRKVHDRELTSISSWMDALPDDKSKK